MRKLLVRSIVAGLLTGLVGLALLPAFMRLEEDLGLSLLFKMRGPLSSPTTVAIVAMDKASADALDLHRDPSRWPRTLHARLLEDLSRQDPAVIAMDIVFADPRGEQEDVPLERAIRNAGNVVLCSYIEVEHLNAEQPDSARATVGRVILPQARFANGASGVAPFPVPKTPGRVTRFWTFQDGMGHTPTLPVAALLGYTQATQPDSFTALATIAAQESDTPDSSRTLHALASAIRRRLLANKPSPAHIRAGTPASEDASNRLESGLREVFRGPDSRLLNFYGPARTLRTISYHDALALLQGPAPDAARAFRDKAVFIGYSDPGVVTSKDGFHTAFADDSGMYMGGVEIAATAFANMLDGSSVRVPSLGMLLLVVAGWGCIQGLIGRALPTWAATLAAAASAAAYTGAAVYVFRQQHLWLPLLLPAGVLPLVAVLGSVVVKHRTAKREKRTLKRAAGYYLPPALVAQLENEARDIQRDHRLADATCMITDAEGYTALAESTEPGKLGQIMQRYFEAAFAPVRNHGGAVMNLTGDSILAVWIAADHASGSGRAACEAALDIAQGVRTFNERAGADALPTRIGLHHGPLRLGSMGALEHYEYVPIGDTVNTAARIEGLNKQLGTRILASAPVLVGVQGLLTRNVGTYRFAGKIQPLEIHEILCRAEDAAPDLRSMCDVFAEAMQHLLRQQWEQAARHFEQVSRQAGGDGPSDFLSALARSFASGRDEAWTGAIPIEKRFGFQLEGEKT